jgi:capsule polysaccharide export protein KpsE/RkpR
MQKYIVTVHGQNLLTKVDGVRKRYGFFTTVFLEAFTPADAESRALELVREDAHVRDITLNAEDDPLRFSADEIQEVESFNDARLPRTGLALYSEDT